MKKWFSGLMALISLNSFAGNGSSGGGFIYGDQVNPWFFQNTDTVTYCIKISPDFSDLSEDAITSTITDAFQYWKKAFKTADYYHLGLSPVPKIATQNFVQVDCESRPDISFQFGTLSDSQLKTNKNIRQTIAVAYRERYDSANLRAQGYIYVAPEKGALRPIGSSFREKPWSDGSKSLLFTLIHEMGHIFGLQDDHSSNESLELMNARFVERISSKEYWKALEPEDLRPLGASVTAEGTTVVKPENQSERDAFEKWFGESSSAYYFVGKGSSIEVTTLSETLGSIQLTSDESIMINENNAQLVSLWLPKNQKVFQVFGLPLQTYLGLVKGKKSFTITGLEFVKTDGSKEKVDCHFSNAWGENVPGIGTIMNNKYIFNIVNHL